MLQAIRAYTNNYVEDKNYKGNGADNLPETPKPRVKELSFDDPNKLLSPKEREFFVELFPESSEQIEKHILFNKNGKLQVVPISKGIIVDGRI